jgi:hypothetical protein
VDTKVVFYFAKYEINAKLKFRKIPRNFEIWYAHTNVIFVATFRFYPNQYGPDYNDFLVPIGKRIKLMETKKNNSETGSIF